MDILFFTPWWPNDEKYSGIFIKEHAKAIANYCNVHVLNVKFEANKWAFPLSIKRNIYKEGNMYVHEIKINFPSVRYATFLFQSFQKRVIFKEIENILKKVDITLIHLNVLSKECNWLLNNTILKQYKFVIAEHSGYYFKAQNKLQGEAYHAFKFLIKSQLEHEKIRIIMPVSNLLKNVLQHEFDITTQMEVIPNVVDIESNFTPFKIKNEPNKKIRVCLIANWEYPKCPQLFMNTLLSLDQEVIDRLEIIWGGFGTQYDEILQNEKYKKLNIQFVGKLPKEAVYELLSKSDMLVHPTISESFSCIVAEALCFGIPVLSNETGVMTEIICNENGVITPHDNQEAFTKGFLDIFHKICNNFYDRAYIRNKAIDSFSPKVVGKQIMNVYKSLSMRDRTTRRE